MSNKKGHSEKDHTPSNSKVRRSLDSETRSNVLKIAKIEEAKKANRTFAKKAAELIAAFCGNIIFVYVHIVFFAMWILANSVFLFVPFDPYPFTFLTLVVSLEAIFLSTFILISQNHETRLTER